MASSVDQKLLRSTKFPPEFNQKVDIRKINVEVMKKWIAGKISEILPGDDVVTEMCFNLLVADNSPNIKNIQIQLTGFLEKDTAAFCKELWNLCLSAQSNPQGVPKELLEAKKLELIQEKTRLPPRCADAESRTKHETETLRASARENGQTGAGTVAEDADHTEEIETSIEDRAEIQDLLRQGDVVPTISASRLQGATWILTSLLVAGEMTGAEVYIAYSTSALTPQVPDSLEISFASPTTPSSIAQRVALTQPT
ncbi:hypothetical protein W97_03554 [Coniosporium apollinis CBS 100218]|uniref:PWI domain-containing protein n=1 Tax=Coniosporium apollinis (strain CBS 100218) TaxID=1168221 RepID=R7YR33_CONA1|nr:uncharacterized protein W97_03554 [Coniosporium apollinis CBS 100218]EON64323.1 hypothetical protein W97_03554 [Coniosporium apollinis CBS 100218]